MLRGLFRLLVLALLLALAGWVASRLMNRDEDFDDFDDVDTGIDFSETPVEIDVPYSAPTAEANAPTLSGGDGASSSAASPAPVPASDAVSGDESAPAVGTSVIDVNGIGPTYAARLKEIGITTLADLAGADPDSIADRLEVIGGRNVVQDWIEQAREMTSSQTPSGSSSGE